MTKIPEAKRQQILQYISQDLDTLYSTLDLIRSSEESILYMPGNEVTRGMVKFKELIPLLRRKVCKEWNYCAKRHDPDLQDTVTIVAAVSDVIATLSLGFPPVLISTILVKKGLTAFCGCHKQGSGGKPGETGEEQDPPDED